MIKNYTNDNACINCKVITSEKIERYYDTCNQYVCENCIDYFDL